MKHMQFLCYPEQLQMMANSIEFQNYEILKWHSSMYFGVVLKLLVFSKLPNISKDTGTVFTYAFSLCKMWIYLVYSGNIFYCVLR